MVGAGLRRLPGWTHLDNDPACAPDLCADITQPLALADASVEVIFCEEVLTQIPPASCIDFLRECRRVLQPGGVIRVLMPDLRRFARAYLDDPDWLRAIWHRHVGIPLLADTACEVLNLGLRGVGPFVYDRETFAVVVARAGLQLHDAEFNRSLHPALAGLDMRGPEETLTAYYELTVPATAAG